MTDEREMANAILDAVRDGEPVDGDLVDWALATTGDAKPNPESRRFAVFATTEPGALQ